MLAIIASLFSSTGFGALIGWVGGLANRYMDFKTKKLDIEMKKLDQKHELDLRDKDMEQVRVELAGQAQIATIEGEAKVEVAGYNALGKSYEMDKATYGIKSIDWIRGFVRPFITLIFVALICYVNYRVWSVIGILDDTVTKELALEVIRWTLFEASVVIGWWFAMRASGSAGLNAAPTKN